jgi:hypothetical protein
MQPLALPLLPPTLLLPPVLLRPLLRRPPVLQPALPSNSAPADLKAAFGRLFFAVSAVFEVFPVAGPQKQLLTRYGMRIM